MMLGFKIHQEIDLRLYWIEESAKNKREILNQLFLGSMKIVQSRWGHENKFIILKVFDFRAFIVFYFNVSNIEKSLLWFSTCWCEIHTYLLRWYERIDKGLGVKSYQVFSIVMDEEGSSLDTQCHCQWDQMETHTAQTENWNEMVISPKNSLSSSQLGVAR